MAKARKLKVFQAHFGFYDTVVAAPSQAAALRAWGVHRNVFADGQARLTTDEAAVAAATAQPETVLKRPVGSDGPFEVDPASLPEIPEAPPGKPAGKTRRAAPAKPPADRRTLDRAEAALRALDQRRKAEEAALSERQAALDAQRDAAQERYMEARRAASAQVVKARDAYRKAGGRD
jgi:hypothetical protein